MPDEEACCWGCGTSFTGLWHKDTVEILDVQRASITCTQCGAISTKSIDLFWPSSSEARGSPASPARTILQFTSSILPTVALALVIITLSILSTEFMVPQTKDLGFLSPGMLRGAGFVLTAGTLFALAVVRVGSQAARPSDDPDLVALTADLAITTRKKSKPQLDSSQDDEQPPALSEQPDGTLEGFRYCHPCRCVKPSACHHCSRCACCIQSMDHHCWFLGRCFGHGNLESLLYFLLWGSAGCLFTVVVSEYVVRRRRILARLFTFLQRRWRAAWSLGAVTSTRRRTDQGRTSDLVQWIRHPEALSTFARLTMVVPTWGGLLDLLDFYDTSDHLAVLCLGTGVGLGVFALGQLLTLTRRMRRGETYVDLIVAQRKAAEAGGAATKAMKKKKVLDTTTSDR